MPELLAEASPALLQSLAAQWAAWAHEHQLAPELTHNGAPWTTWLVLGGRGAGKTRAGAQWVRGIALSDNKARIALIGESEHETREVMIEGVSGLLAVHAAFERPQWISSRRRVEWRNGAIAQTFSADELTLLECPGFAAVLGHALWSGRAELINGLANLSGLLMTYMAVRFGVLGVYVTGRSREKQAMTTGEVIPSIAGEVLKAIARRK